MSFQMHDQMKELTGRCIILAILLTMLLAASNAYLALKLGLLTSASIPAAIISMGVLRFFKGATILENNAVQTAASAGEAIAGGIVYTIPALIIIHYWHHFDYFTNVCIAFLGGLLGVLFSVPLRGLLVNEPLLQFPEGKAIAELLKSSDDGRNFGYLLTGGLIGALLEFFQEGLHLFASSWGTWFFIKHTVFGLSLGFSATLIGAGYLVGQEMACSIFLGALIAWFIALPLVSTLLLHTAPMASAHAAMLTLWEHELRYFGIGAMLCAGAWTFVQLAKPLWRRMRASWRVLAIEVNTSVSRTEQDLPGGLIALLLILVAVSLYYFFQITLPLQAIGFSTGHVAWLVLAAVSYVFVVGGFFSIITAYFSGLVGVSASPGSSVVIAGILFAAWLLLSAVHYGISLPLDAEQLKAAEAVTIMVASVVTGIAAIANDNTQDLKVGQLVGATPWKQQMMLLLGVTVSALVIPPVMQLLYDVYGIAGVMPRANMDVSRSLPAPTAALFAAITEAVFHHELPWSMMWSGGAIIALLVVLSRPRIAVLGVAVGMYLPLSTSVPLLFGGLIARQVTQGLRRANVSLASKKAGQQIGTLIACGLVAGAALMNVFVALLSSLTHRQDIFSLFGARWQPVGVILSVLVLMGLARWIVYSALRSAGD